MKLKNMWKRFWTLDVHNHEGFTLVELIIVIAILAILSTGAIAGYSAYVERANITADEALAAEVKNALILAMYSDGLTPGDYVVIKYDGSATCGNDNDPSATTIDAAMTAAYGEGWKNMLKLKWNGWDSGVAGNAETMEIVKNSNFSYDNMDNLLSQVQVVVGAASGYLEGKEISAQAAELLKSNGVNISAGDKLTTDTANAAANAYVYLVGGELADLDLSGNSDSWSPAAGDFMTSWMSNGAPSTDNFDLATGSAVQYASIYALATYIDKNSGGTTNYVAQLEGKGGTTILTDANTILTDMKNKQPGLCADYMTPAEGESNPAAYKDAVSFLAYMQGLDSSTDSLMQNTNLMNKDYFVDGYVAKYVDDYITVSGALTANGNSGSSFVFLYTGEEVRCMPLDW